MPTQLIEKPRNVCALGAFQTLLAIDGAVPVSHSGPGCLSKLGAAIGSQNGGQLAGPLGPNMIPCSGLSNTEVVFGGEEKLRSLIETSQKVIQGDFYVVINGCTPSLVGDDVAEVTGSFARSEKPVIFAETAGFLGNNIWGHGKILEDIVSNLVAEPARTNPKQVNIWGIIPYFDPFWLGTLQEIQKLLEEIGLEPHVIYGRGQGLPAIKKLSEAGFNLVIGPWWDLDTARILGDKFGTPLLHYPVLPIGPTETNRFLREVTRFADLSPARTEAVIQKHEADYYVYLERAITEFVEVRRFPKHFTTVANSSYALGVTRFLTNDLGMIPDTQYVTDGVPDRFTDGLRAQFADLREGITAEVVFTEDGGLIHQELSAARFNGKPFILGSSWEKALTNDLDGYFLSISSPASDRLIMDRSYFGYRGGLRLIEDFYSVVQGDFQ